MSDKIWNKKNSIDRSKYRPDLEYINGEFKDGRSYRLFKCPETGVIELTIDAADLRHQNQTADFEPVISVQGFNYPCD